MKHVRKADVMFCLHRGLLQSKASSLRHRLYQPARDGAKSSLTLFIFSGEDQARVTQDGARRMRTIYGGTSEIQRNIIGRWCWGCDLNPSTRARGGSRE